VSLFDACGVVLAAYAAYAAVTGRVIAKRGSGMTPVNRTHRPGYFWSVVAIYAGLAVALVLAF